MWPGCLLSWFLFHSKDWILWMLGKVEDKHPGKWWFSKDRSMYFEMFFEDDEEEEEPVKAEGGSPDIQKVAPAEIN